MSFVLRFEVAGDVQVARGFSRFADAAKDLRPAFREIVADFRKGEREQFATEGRYGSGGWVPLSLRTQLFKAQYYPGATILVRTGRLRESLAASTADTIEELRPLRLQVGSRVPYAIFHQHGTSQMPPRPPIDLPETQRTRWHKIIHARLVHEARTQGLL